MPHRSNEGFDKCWPRLHTGEEKASVAQDMVEDDDETSATERNSMCLFALGVWNWIGL